MILFILSNEVCARAIKPVLEFFIRNGAPCKLLINDFTLKNYQQLNRYYIESIDAQKIEFDFVISANPIDKKLYKGKAVCIHHGSMFGNSSWSLRTAASADVYFGLSSYELNYIKSYLKDKFDKKLFIPSGNPANDYLVNHLNYSNEKKNKEKKILGLSEKPIILITSHWTSHGNLRKFGTGLIDALAYVFPSHQVVFTCHPTILSNPKKEFLVDKTVKTPYFDSGMFINLLKSKENSQIKIFTNEVRSSELLALSDIFIGDNSSLIAEASLFNIPLISRSDISYFNKKIETLIRQDSYQFKNIEELIAVIRFITNSKDVNLRTGKKIKHIFMSNVGSATETIYKSLMSI